MLLTEPQVRKTEMQIVVKEELRQREFYVTLLAVEVIFALQHENIPG